MRTKDFSYELPPSLIAQEPIMPRDASRLLYLAAQPNVDPMAQADLRFSDLGELLNDGDLLVFNDSRVIPARLIGTREGLKRDVEIFLLRPLANGHWTCLARPGKRLKVGHEVIFPRGMKAKIEDVLPDGLREVSFMYEGTWEEALERNGEVPLPPYIEQKLADPERYQTVYSKFDGSVAAPTAGLHFTGDFLDKLTDKGIEFAYVTLHVGLGTFRTVQEDQIENHVMHAEYCILDADNATKIQCAKDEGRRVVAVGTTACRVLETFATDYGKIQARQGESEIFIYPPYEFKIVDSLITNFHLPESTLLMLVSALAGRENILQAYRHAVEQRYRFFSFGDAMFIDPQGKSAATAQRLALTD